MRTKLVDLVPFFFSFILGLAIIGWFGVTVTLAFTMGVLWTGVFIFWIMPWLRKKVNYYG